MEDSTRSHVLTALGALVGGVVGAALASGLGPDLVANMLIGGAAGGLAGLLPYFVGRKKDRDLAIKAVWVCVGAGMILGLLLAVPVAIVFTIVLSKKEPAAEGPREAAVGEAA